MCISNKLPGDAGAAGLGQQLPNHCSRIKVLSYIFTQKHYNKIHKSIISLYLLTIYITDPPERKK